MKKILRKITPKMWIMCLIIAIYYKTVGDEFYSLIWFMMTCTAHITNSIKLLFEKDEN